MKHRWTNPRIAVMLAALVLGGCAADRSNAHLPQRDTALARHYIAQGVEQLDKGQLDQAQTLFGHAIDADAYSGVAYNDMGITYFRRKNYYQAAWYFQNAARLMPYQPQPRNNLGLVFEAAGKLDDAVNEYKQALSLEPDNPQLIGNLARARIRHGDSGPDIHQLLQDLVMHETRPEWRQWAQRQLVLIKNESNDAAPDHPPEPLGTPLETP